MEMSIEDGCELIKTAYRKDAEDKLWERWNLEHMFMEEPVSFEDYKNKMLQSNNETNIKNKELILKEAELIKSFDQSKGKEVD